MINSRLLAVNSDAKTPKGRMLGFLTGVLYLAPLDIARTGVNVCRHASAACAAACLFAAGRGGMRNVHAARVAKTRRLLNGDRAGFLADLHASIARLIRRAQRENLKPAVRLNGTSDLDWHRIDSSLFGHDARFYDYTKDFGRALRNLYHAPNGYHVTFSLAENNAHNARQILEQGGNVAAIIDRPWSHGMRLRIDGALFETVNGDKTDARFLDPRGTVAALTFKVPRHHRNARDRATARGFIFTPE